LIAGLKCGIYFEAFTKTGDPADISGHILEKKSNTLIANVETTHEVLYSFIVL
jgi:hypothetical protein